MIDMTLTRFGYQIEKCKVIIKIEEDWYKPAFLCVQGIGGSHYGGIPD